MCTDIQMPGQMDGVGLAHAVHERWPTIRIIVVSGQLNLPHLDLPPRSRLLGKPLNAVEVIAEMRDMIGYA
jgi:DNA-binding NtrC family response regulator